MVLNYLGVKHAPYFTFPLHCPGVKFVFLLEPQMGYCLTQPQALPTQLRYLTLWKCDSVPDQGTLTGWKADDQEVVFHSQQQL